MKKGAVLWFTGLSGAGKTTIARNVLGYLRACNVDCEWLDGDNVREYLSQDLGFSKKDRDENIRRVSFVANLLSKHGVIVLASFISPYRSHREMIRKNSNNFIEVFVKTPLEICEKRDVKGLYKKARKGEIEFFTGVSDRYEKPKNPDIVLETDKMNVPRCTREIISFLVENKYI
ncbi:MAG: adenylyl-sulfate kinase [Candidatus Marinimicrobia bacterium]|nr:adenylyl-sulfate kinase [Candidatus Neomarinimicrobiota bacterium]